MNEVITFRVLRTHYISKLVTYVHHKRLVAVEELVAWVPLVLQDWPCFVLAMKIKNKVKAKFLIFSYLTYQLTCIVCDMCLWWAGVLGPVWGPGGGIIGGGPPAPWLGCKVLKFCGLMPPFLFSSLIPRRWNVAYGLMSSSALAIEPPTKREKKWHPLGIFP